MALQLSNVLIPAFSTNVHKDDAKPLADVIGKVAAKFSVLDGGLSLNPRTMRRENFRTGNGAYSFYVSIVGKSKTDADRLCKSLAASLGWAHDQDGGGNAAAQIDAVAAYGGSMKKATKPKADKPKANAADNSPPQDAPPQDATDNA